MPDSSLRAGKTQDDSGTLVVSESKEVFKKQKMGVCQGIQEPTCKASSGQIWNDLSKETKT